MQTDGRTDRRTELLYQYRASVCCMTRDKNAVPHTLLVHVLLTFAVDMVRVALNLSHGTLYRKSVDNFRHMCDFKKRMI